MKHLKGCNIHWVSQMIMMSRIKKEFCDWINKIIWVWFPPLDLCKDGVILYTWNVQKAQSRCNIINDYHTRTRPPVSCVRGKYANHLHHTGYSISCRNTYIQVYKIYIQFLYNIIQNTSHLWPYLLYNF